MVNMDIKNDTFIIRVDNGERTISGSDVDLGVLTEVIKEIIRIPSDRKE